MPKALPRRNTPHPFDSFTEASRTGIELALLQLSQGLLHKITPNSDPRPIMVIPGFLGADWTTAPIRQFLRQKGHIVYGWDGGLNTGPNPRNLEHLESHFHRVAKENHKQKITLIGHSLGGIFARELARAFPDKVSQVITLGSPFAAGSQPESVNSLVRWAFDLINGHNHPFVSNKSFIRQSAEPPPVPTTSIYSRGDGVVHWKTCLNPAKHPHAENVEVIGSHCGLVVNPLAMLVCADRLTHTAGKNFRPFAVSDYLRRIPYALSPS